MLGKAQQDLKPVLWDNTSRHHARASTGRMCGCEAARAFVPSNNFVVCYTQMLPRRPSLTCQDTRAHPRSAKNPRKPAMGSASNCMCTRAAAWHRAAGGLVEVGALVAGVNPSKAEACNATMHAHGQQVTTACSKATWAVGGKTKKRRRSANECCCDRKLLG